MINCKNDIIIIWGNFKINSILTNDWMSDEFIILLKGVLHYTWYLNNCLIISFIFAGDFYQIIYKF